MCIWRYRTWFLCIFDGTECGFYVYLKVQSVISMCIWRYRVWLLCAFEDTSVVSMCIWMYRMQFLCVFECADCDFCTYLKAKCSVLEGTECDLYVYLKVQSVVSMYIWRYRVWFLCVFEPVWRRCNEGLVKWSPQRTAATTTALTCCRSNELGSCLPTS